MDGSQRELLRGPTFLSTWSITVAYYLRYYSCTDIYTSHGSTCKCGVEYDTDREMRGKSFQLGCLSVAFNQGYMSPMNTEARGFLEM